MPRVFLILLLSTSLFAQEKGLEFSCFKGNGFELTTAEDFSFTTSGLQLKYIKESKANREWKHYYNLPRMGQELLFANYSENGYAIKLNTFIEFEFLSSEKSQFYFSPSIGLAYTSETSETLDNYRLISLPINFSIKAEVGYRYKLSPHLRVVAGYIVHHLSNGDIQSPNDGLNFGAWKLGINYILHEEPSLEKKAFEKPEYAKYFAQVSMGSGIKSNSVEQYGFFNTFLVGGYRLHPYHHVIGGVSLFNSFYQQDLQTGFNGGYQIIVGSIGVSFQVGYYTEPLKGESRYYMFTLQHQFKSSLFLQASLRTSEKFFSEDLSIGLGFQLEKKNKK